jgi:hypothetical protein
MSRLFLIGIALVVVGAVILLYYSSINLKCLCPVGQVNCCAISFLIQKIMGILLLVAGGALLILNYARGHRAASEKERTANE